MAYDPAKDPGIMAAQKRAAESEAQAREKAERLRVDDKLACTKGQTPEQIEARKRVVAVFCEYHLPQEPPDAVKAIVAAVDCTQTVSSVNGRGLDLERPKSTGLLGLGRKPRYLVSRQHPPKTPEDPIYALEYFPLKS